jgi:hypothetical protein
VNENDSPSWIDGSVPSDREKEAGETAQRASFSNGCPK